ncbi:hypothetical protein [Desulfuribacillus alkaliarsenatis]|uniref:Diaminopimelate epimerase n=1 Tax=Desulfuribacillus alkaliarsenatis TaxID=766136 RepID=A0A1E5G3C2_9FIRM|nr:hypothetical protein [Desulfuribacillus alkaliarsenatis]OEF97082.1 hypothetical protein BHF68_05645 [Desulfuribacillus alkaliarsenatis]
MKLNFIKVNPTENMTIFITTPVPRNLYKEVAKSVMNYASLHAEQVGFVEACNGGGIKLHMMGGEFCANATIGLAATLVNLGHPIVERGHGSCYMLDLEVSGVVTSITCCVEKLAESNRYISTIQMPLHNEVLPYNMEISGKTYSGTLVKFPGIMHLIVDTREIANENKEEFFHKVKDSFKDENYEALGIMYYDKVENYMEPLVYVKATDSLHWERGCGSGTAAVGAAMSELNKESVNLDISQPGGSIRVTTVVEDNKIKEILLSSKVQIVAEGTVYL